MSDHKYFLFPHTQLSAPDLKKVIARFGQLTICRPWFMEESVGKTDDGGLGAVRIQYPSEALKPKADFKKAVSEYLSWVNQNHDKGYGNFLGITQKNVSGEDTPWEIRQLISKGDQDLSHTQETETFKWHLVLHLAREFDDNRMQAEEMLLKLKDRRSPLEGALEADPPQRFFENTPLMKTHLQVDNNHLRQVFEAWFGLFREFVSEDVSLITVDPYVMNYAAGILESGDRIINSSSDSIANQALKMHLQLPKVPANGSRSKDPVLSGLSGKTIILMEN